MQETWVPSLGRKDPLGKGMATHSSFLAWKIPWTEEPGRLQSKGSQRVGHDLATKQQQQYNIFSSTHFRIILFHCHFIYFYFLNTSYDLPSPFTLYILLLSSVLKFRTSGDFFLLFSHEVVSDSLYPHGL